MRRGSIACSFLAILALCVTAAHGATITVFNARPSFTTASGSLNTLNFEGIAPNNGFAEFPNPGLTTSGINFFTSGTGPFGSGIVTVLGAGLASMQSPVLNTGTGAILSWGPPNQPGTAFLNAVLPPGITAVGTDFWAQQPFVAAVDITVNAVDATSQTFTVNTVNRPTPSFIGFTSDVAISSLLFRTPQGQTGLVVDNFSLGQASTTEPPVSQVPEPATALLLAGGLIGIAAVRKMKPE